MTTAAYFNLYRQARRRAEQLPNSSRAEWQRKHDAYAAAEMLAGLYWGKVAHRFTDLAAT